MKSGVVLQVENYILSLDGGRAVDTDLLAEYGEAGIDLGFNPAKYRVARPAATVRRDEHGTVNVYPTGKIVCLGGKSVERARADVRMVLRRLGVSAAAGAGAAAGGDGDAEAAVRYVVMSGCIFGGHDVHRAIPRLREKYDVTLDLEVFSGYFVKSRGKDNGGNGGNGDDNDGYDGVVSIQVFAQDGDCAGADDDDAAECGEGGRAVGRTPLLCRGPTVRDIRRVVGDVYRTIVESGVGRAT